MSAGTRLIRVFGEVDVASAPAVGRALQEAEVSAATSVVLDLSGVTFLDSLRRTGSSADAGMVSSARERPRFA